MPPPLLLLCSPPQQEWGEGEDGDLPATATKSRYVVAELPVKLPVLRPAPPDKPTGRLGVGEFAGAGGAGPCCCCCCVCLRHALLPAP